MTMSPNPPNPLAPRVLRVVVDIEGEEDAREDAVLVLLESEGLEVELGLVLVLRELGGDCVRFGLELGSAPPLASCNFTQSAPPSERTRYHMSFMFSMLRVRLNGTYNADSRHPSAQIVCCIPHT